VSRPCIVCATSLRSDLPAFLSHLLLVGSIGIVPILRMAKRLA
jgi:hypothetical protein